MSTFLQEQVRSSARRVVRARAERPIGSLIRQADRAPAPRPLRLGSEGFDVIAEVKLRSPSRGLLAEPGQAADYAAAQASRYARAGAAAISVLTEPHAFGGDLAHLAAAARAVDVPVMRKDFLVDPYQVFEARAAGASGVLLIVRCLHTTHLWEMLEAARQTGMFVLLESFDERDLERVRTLASLHDFGDQVLLAGVNSRNLSTLEGDAGRFAELAPGIPFAWPAVAESHLERPADAAAVAGLGYELALVGTALMRSDAPQSLLERMLSAGRRVAGSRAGRRQEKIA